MGTRITALPVGEIRPGDHAAFPFATAAEQAQVIGPFLRDGLAARQKVIYVGERGHRGLPGLGDPADADRLVRTGQLRVIPSGVVWLSQGRFDPDRMFAVIGREVTEAAEQGYPAVRLTADMSWALRRPGAYPLMLACEARFAEAIAAETAVMAICQLDRSRCPAEQVRALTGTHRLRVTANPVFDDGVLRITRSHAPDGLRLAGELDTARQEPLLTALTSIGAAADAHLDFAEVRFLDLGILSLLVTYALRTSPGRRLVLDNLPPDVAGLIQTLGWRHLPGLARGRSRLP
ncbi:MEDS domain-containing protein [Actinoallomurus sp. NBC_01490]|uniref:MEDS domain-containing protein n=1 Tax=Actinoallomurus sp. NBC_01490 TaxID=2903557 RepID=UPI002E2EB63B|nr:MEDS domain-containing protein [Actinoallomurus sp. NBC_01490]